MNYDSIETAKKYSIEGRKNLKKDFDSEINSNSFCIVTTGSYARDEASEASDLDCFVITEDEIDKNYFVCEGSSILSQQLLKDLMNKIVNKYISKDAGDTGTFGLEAVVTITDLITNIGGSEDTNIQLTRRMLFLLEGKCLYNDILFDKFRKMVIEEYIKKTVSDNQLSRFFLNDIIRFYRTMATDFEHKVSEKGKEWGLRNIKLTFSRKLLYFAGIITIAETAKKTRDEKISETLRLLNMVPLERIKYITQDKVEDIFRLYNYFLEKISNDSIRTELDKAHRESTVAEQPPIFRELKDKSKDFSLALALLLEEKYDKKHPIHHAIIF